MPVPWTHGSSVDVLGLHSGLQDVLNNGLVEGSSVQGLLQGFFRLSWRTCFSLQVLLRIMGATIDHVPMELQHGKVVQPV